MNYMDMDLDEIFDLEPEETEENAEDTGAENEQENGDPAQDEDFDGENDQDTDAEPDEEGEEKKPLTPEQRHANAARRRAAEIEKAKQEVRDYYEGREKRIFESLKMKDAYNGNTPIESYEQFQRYDAAKEDKALERELASGRMTVSRLKETIGKVVDDKMIPRAQAEQPAPSSAQKKMVDDQYAEIQALDPDAPNFDELAKDQEFMSEVRRTGNMVQAYKRVHVDKLLDRQAQIGKRDAMLRDQSKAHLTRTSTRGIGSVEVTNEMRARYRIFDPDITDEEIRKSETAYQKSKKR